MRPFTDGNTEAQRESKVLSDTQLHQGSAEVHTDAGRLQSPPALVPARAWRAQKDASPCSAALDCPAQPYHEAPPADTHSPLPPAKMPMQGFPRDARPTCQALAGTDPRTVITIQHTALLPQVPKDPEAHSTLELLPPTCVPAPSTKVPKTLGAWTKLTHFSCQPSREDSACLWLWA